MNPFLPESVQRDLVLASGSPRRIDLLRSLGFEFRVEPARVGLEDEPLSCCPAEVPLRLAALKAKEVAERFPDSIVIGADTVVILDGEILEKPGDEGEWRLFLRKLSGRSHLVVTGLVLRRKSTALELGGKEETRVRFKELGESEIETYIASGEGKDKAGGYAVQGLGSCLIQSIEGCFFNVVGLPVALLMDMLKKV